MNNNRQNWIDLAKGVAILLVRIGHISSGFLLYMIYSFHMPLFFILSGYCYTDKGNSIIKEILRKAKAILTIFFSYELFKWFMSSLISLIYRKSINFQSFYQIIINDPNSLQYHGVWFFSCLFLSYAVFIIILNLTSRFKCYKLLLLNIGVFFISIMTYLFCKEKWFWNFDVSLIMLPFLSIGYTIKMKGWFNLLFEYCKEKKYMYFFIFILFAILTILNAKFGNSNIDYILRNINEYCTAILCGVIGTCFLSLICRGGYINSRVIRFIGANSAIYYLTLGTLSARIKSILLMVGVENEVIRFVISLCVACIVLIPICNIINWYFPFFYGRRFTQENKNNIFFI